MAKHCKVFGKLDGLKEKNISFYSDICKIDGNHYIEHLTLYNPARVDIKNCKNLRSITIMCLSGMTSLKKRLSNRSSRINIQVSFCNSLDNIEVQSNNTVETVEECIFYESVEHDNLKEKGEVSISLSSCNSLKKSSQIKQTGKIIVHHLIRDIDSFIVDDYKECVCLENMDYVSITHPSNMILAYNCQECDIRTSEIKILDALNSVVNIMSDIYLEKLRTKHSTIKLTAPRYKIDHMICLSDKPVLKANTVSLYGYTEKLPDLQYLDENTKIIVDISIMRKVSYTGEKLFDFELICNNWSPLDIIIVDNFTCNSFDLRTYTENVIFGLNNVTCNNLALQIPENLFMAVDNLSYQTISKQSSVNMEQILTKFQNVTSIKEQI